MKHLTEAEGPPLTEIPAPSWIFDRIDEWAGRFPRRFAFAIDRQDHVDEYTYTDVLKQADAFAGDLAALGIKPGDRIGILMENIPEWVFVLLGAMRFGTITSAVSNHPAGAASGSDRSACRLPCAVHR